MTMNFNSFNTYNEGTGKKGNNFNFNRNGINQQNKENLNINVKNSKNNFENFLKQGIQDSSRIEEMMINGIKEKNPYKNIVTKRTKAVTMKIRIASIRDRWLMNIREFDYEIYLASSFLLILTKKRIEFIKETKMMRLVNQDAQNLLHFIENNRSLEELRALKRLREKNMKNLELKNYDFYIQRKDRFLDLMNKNLTPMQIRPNGIFIKINKKKSDYSYLKLNDISVKVEERPKDINRYKAINENWLNWSESTEVANYPSRVLLDAYHKEKEVQYSIYCKSKLQSKKLRDYMIINFNKLEDSKNTIDFGILKQRVKTAEWFYMKIMNFCRIKLGATDLFFQNARDMEGAEMEVVEKDLPIFLNKGLLALGSFSIFNISGENFKRGIDIWGQEDLSRIEIGHREQHFKDLPTFTFDKVICTLDNKDIPYSAFIDVAVIKNRRMIIKKHSVGFTFSRRINKITYLELANTYKKKSFMHLEDIFTKINQNDSITIRITLRIGDKRYEDFEFSLYAYVRSFYVKTISYVDFFDKDYVLVMKSLKLHKAVKYDEFSEVFEKQNIFIDDFNSSRALFPNFSPRVLLDLERSFLPEEEFSDEIDIEMGVQDGYVSNFYKELFFKMRYDLIEQNFVKAKINFDLWWSLVNKLKVPKHLRKSFSYHYNLNTPKSIENLSVEISSDDRIGFSELMMAITFGIKNEVRGVLWENLADRHPEYKVKIKLDKFAPLVVEELYIILNKPDKYGVKCLFRTHQRIVTHFMAILEKMSLGHPNTLSMLAEEVRNVVLMLHEFFTKDHFKVAARAILVLGSLMHECPDDQDQALDYFLRKAQREAAFLKILLGEFQSKILKKIFDLGLTVEGLFGTHLVHSFSNLFQIELVLRIRDLYFLFQFYSLKNRHKDFDFFILFKCCLIIAILEKYKYLLLGIQNANEFIQALEIACKSETELKEILIFTYDLMDDIIHKKNVNFSKSSAKSKLPGLKHIKKKFNLLNQFLKSWDLEEVTLNINQKSFVPLLEHTQEFFKNKKYKPIEKGDSQRFMNSLREGREDSNDSLPDILDTSNPEALVPVSSLKPKTFNKTVSDNTVAVYFHGLRFSDNQAIFHLYLYSDDKVIFTSRYCKINGFQPRMFTFNPPSELENIEIRIREEKENGEFGFGALDVDNYVGRIELRRYRVGVVESDTIPLRYFSDGVLYTNMEQCDLKISVILNYMTKIPVSDFEEKIGPIEKFLQLENYWKYSKKWLLPDFVEQNSLLLAKDFHEFTKEFFNIKKENSKNRYSNKGIASILKNSNRTTLDRSCLLPFSKFLELNYEMVPLSRAFINGIFYTNLSTSEKMHLLWDTLNFFENLQNSNSLTYNDGCLESDTLRYFIKVIAKRCWPSIPEFSIDNLVDLNFYGRTPCVVSAVFHCGPHVVDLTDFFVSLSNHVHLATGKKELDFSNLKFLDSVKRHIFESYKVISDIEKGELYIGVLSNRGRENFVVEFKETRGKFDLEKVLESQKKRILIENQKRRITREKYERVLPEFGIFSHVSTLDSFKVFRERYRVNGFILMNEEYFEAIVLHSGNDALELYEDFPEWNRKLIDEGVDEGEYLCFLMIRPWELLVVKDEFIVFL